jgi:hypothetical protein
VTRIRLTLAGVAALVGELVGAWFLHSQNRQTFAIAARRVTGAVLCQLIPSACDT